MRVKPSIKRRQRMMIIWGILIPYIFKLLKVALIPSQGYLKFYKKVVLKHVNCKSIIKQEGPKIIFEL